MDLKPPATAGERVPWLPPLYEPVYAEGLDSVLDEACRRAEDGAEEGTLVYSPHQRAARGRCGQVWLSPPGGLAAAVVLRPEEPEAVRPQLGLVGLLALGSAVAEHVSPLTELHYRWPNDLLLRQGKAGGVQLRWRTPDWLVLAVNVNVSAPPSALGLDAAAVQVDGECTVTAEQLLGSFARQLLVWLDRWANDGFAPLAKAWLQRAVGLGEPFEVVAAGQRYSGRFTGLDEAGNLQLQRGEVAETIGLREAFACTESQRGS